MRHQTCDFDLNAKVYDVDTKTEILNVVEINTKTNKLTIWEKNKKLTPTGRIPTKTIEYRSIYLIKGGADKPCLVHCYGRVNKVFKHRSGQFGINYQIAKFK